VIGSFDDWWAKLSAAEQKLIGMNNAVFVWNEARRQAPSVLFLDSFQLCRSGDELIIMRSSGPSDGEGGRFSLKEFEDAVNEFFNERF
jgi:hypothetical protein